MERDSLEFPDEVDTPLDQPASTRFARYRGLQNFGTAQWDVRENLPFRYSQIYQFENFEQAQNATLREEQELYKAGMFSNSNSMEDIASFLPNYAAGVVIPGVQVRITVSVPEDIAKLIYGSLSRPLIVSTLFANEHKVSVVNFQLRRKAEYSEPIKGKTPLMIHCGFRRYLLRPVYSDDAVSGKHLIDRFFQLGRFTVATAYCPIMYPPAPVLAFLPSSTYQSASSKRFYDSSEYVAFGSLLNVDPLRMNIKRIVLTGYCVRVHKRGAVVRFMFFNAEDVRWFTPVQLRTKNGLVGEIREPLGTKGYFKCIFNDFIKQNDTVCMYLYKRQYPKWDEDIIANFA